MFLLHTLFFTLLLVLLALLSPSVSAMQIGNSYDAKVGRVDGLLPDSAESNSDFLTGTFCYCAHKEDGHPPNHYYQVDYFNVHYDKTFIIHQTCHGHIKDKKHSCLPEGMSESLMAGVNQEKWKRKWKHWSWWTLFDLRPFDQLTYIPNHHREGADFIKFNHHKRDLSPKGNQGMMFVPKEEAEAVCEGLCWEHFGTKTLVMEDDVVLDHQVYWDDLDDMCHKC